MKLHGVDIFTAREFASTVPGHREGLRAFLKSEILRICHNRDISVRASDVDRIDDLKHPPRLMGWGLSLSHCPLVGGAAIKPPDKISRSNQTEEAIGFDLEVGSRISTAAVVRVANLPAEKALFETLQKSVTSSARACAWFWCAKEASIKLLGNSGLQTPVYSDIEVFEMHEDTENSSRGVFSARALESTIEIAGDVFDIELEHSDGEPSHVTAALAYNGSLKTRR